jgi:membrane protein
MILGATSLFSQLQDALNLVWGVKPRIAAGLRGYARHMLLKRLLSFGFVVLVGVALLVLLVTKTVVATLAAFVVGPNPFVLQAGELAISITLGTGLFAVLFRWLPDGTIGWRHALVGGIATATLVSIAAMGVGYYLAHVGARSTYGAAGAVTAILLWAFVSAQAFFWSASFTVAHAAVYGDGVRLDPHVRRALAAGPAAGRHA